MFLILPLIALITTGCNCAAFSLRELETVLQTKRLENLQMRRVGENVNGQCSIVGYKASCCQHLEVDKVKLNSTVCVAMTYLPSDLGLSLTLTVDNKVYINETVSARSPPALCAELPYTKELASICLKFYNLDFSKSTFSGCVKVIIDLAYITVADEDIGCFKIPPVKEQRSQTQVQSSRLPYGKLGDNELKLIALKYQKKIFQI